ncbi:hypothetical protein [Paenibacillus sp. TC-CSREp1]
MLTGEKAEQSAENKKISGAASAAPFFAPGSKDMKRKYFFERPLERKG